MEEEYSKTPLKQPGSWRLIGKQTGLWLNHALSVVYPSRCHACQTNLDEPEPTLCPRCWQLLQESLEPEPCPTCGRNTGPYALVEGRCHRCRGRRPALDAVVRVGEYVGVLREMVLTFKFRQRPHLDDFLGSLLAAAIMGRQDLPQIDYLIPIPLHWRRRWQRGYNQADLIAQAACTHLNRAGYNLAINRDLLRIRYTIPQTSLPPSKRIHNLRGAFNVTPDHRLEGAQVLLVDDVTTTGTTLQVAARTLRQAGVAGVRAAVLAVAAND